MSLNFYRCVYITGLELTTPVDSCYGAKVSGDEVPEKLKQNINTVHILKLMMAFHDGTSHDVATKVGDNNTLMYGQFSLVLSSTSLQQQESQTYSYIENC